MPLTTLHPPSEIEIFRPKISEVVLTAFDVMLLSSRLMPRHLTGCCNFATNETLRVQKIHVQLSLAHRFVWHLYTRSSWFICIQLLSSRTSISSATTCHRGGNTLCESTEAQFQEWLYEKHAITVPDMFEHQLSLPIPQEECHHVRYRLMHHWHLASGL